ncbi:helix-turn-helix domain-containing protein [Glutamicibacter uratoxydans]|uniref:helix-turn-helix domain-containing protein n=1 Tax=Glutamicibacter uratoxydans TaxID=43667 RepID=UPI003D6F0BCF
MESSSYTASALGARIKHQRKTLGLTQAELARSVGVSRKFLIDLEAGKETAALGLVLKVLQELGFEEPGMNRMQDRGAEIARAFQQTLAMQDYEYALRLVSEYTTESLEKRGPLLREAPVLEDPQYFVALAALTRWIASKTQSHTPRWARRVLPSPEPVFLSEKIYPVGDRMKELIRAETPIELKELNVWMRERSLATA